MRVELVTSFSLAGAELYGRRCVASVRAHWPHPLTVYADAPIALDVPVRLTTDMPGWVETKAGLPSSRPTARMTGYDEWTRKPTSYLWDAKRFAVKPFVWRDAAVQMGRGFVVWLDGDTVTTADVPHGFIADLMDDVDVAYLGRGAMHPDTGIVVFRIPEALPLLRWCREAYTSDAFTALHDGWTDCHVLRAGMRAVPVRAEDVTSHLSSEWTSSVDAVALSPFGPYVTHRKGAKQKREAA